MKSKKKLFKEFFTYLTMFLKSEKYNDIIILSIIYIFMELVRWERLKMNERDGDMSTKCI